MSYYYFNVYGNLTGTNTPFYFHNYGTNSYDIVSTTYNYDPNTKIASGNFTISLDGSNNSTGYNAIITGSYQSTPLDLITSKSIRETHQLTPKAE
jgi:hypothetical protein